MVPTAEERIAALEARIQHLEDVEAITRLLATYGPAVDSDSRTIAGGLFAEDAVWSTSAEAKAEQHLGAPVIWKGGAPMNGRAEVEGMLSDSLHQFYLSNGCAHLLSLPRISVNGDTAIAIAHQHIVDFEDGGYRIARASAHRFDLVRVNDGRWQIKRRTSRLLDGSPEPRELLREALVEIS